VSLHGHSLTYLIQNPDKGFILWFSHRLNLVDVNGS
jgi:hypothetical protein